MTPVLVQEVGALNNTVLVALIVALGSLASTAVIAVTTSRREHKRQAKEAEIRRKDKQEDWARQDEVARRAEAAAERVQEVAAQAATAAKLLVDRQDTAAALAAKAADDLIAANKRLSEETVKAALLVNGKLDQIHTLVNSNLTEAMEGKLGMTDALVVALKLAPDSDTPQVRERIKMLEATSIELRAQLADRKRQTKVADAQVKQGESGGLLAHWDAEGSSSLDES